MSNLSYSTTDRGFNTITDARGIIVHESSVVGDYDDAWDRPGSSALWFCSQSQLNREQVRELSAALNHWLETGRLPTQAIA